MFHKALHVDLCHYTDSKDKDKNSEKIRIRSAEDMYYVSMRLSNVSLCKMCICQSMCKQVRMRVSADVCLSLSVSLSLSLCLSVYFTFL